MRGRRLPVINRSADNLIVCGPTLCAILLIAACGSSSSSPGSMQPNSPSPRSSPSPPASFSVFGRVFEVISGAHVPAADFPMLVRVLSRNCTAPVCTNAQSTRTGPDGRYSFGELPEGRVVVTANTAAHAQVCGATSVLGMSLRLLKFSGGSVDDYAI
jgi:hypothetical protein